MPDESKLPPQLDETLDAKPYEPPKRQSCGLADAALGMGLAGNAAFCIGVVTDSSLLLIVAFSCALIAVVLGIVAMVKVGRSEGRLAGLGRASAGMTFGLLSMLWPLLLPAVKVERPAPPRSACKNNLRQIGIALHLYADDNGGEFSPELGLLYATNYTDNPKILRCWANHGKWRPASGSERVDLEKLNYVYVAGLRASDPGPCVLAFDRLGNHDGAGRNVLCLDSSVQWIKAPESGEPDVLKEMLGQTREAVKKRGGEIKLVGE